jgi:hypothetical protein
MNNVTGEDKSLLATSQGFYTDGGLGDFERSRHRLTEWRSLAVGYVWGRDDAGDRVGFSDEFSQVYALANVVTGGYSGPVQAAFHEWMATGRVLVKLDGSQRNRIASVHMERDQHGSPRAVCRLVPWAGSTVLRWWDNKPPARKVCMVKH